MNYKKSILSLAAILAFNNSVSADPNASYVRLTNKTYDKAWVMFGVNNFGDGTSSAPSASGVFTAGYDTVTEADPTDDLASPSLAVIAAAVTGTYFKDSGTKNMATFQALKDASGAPYYTAPVTMGLKTSDLTFSETQPIRSMYIAIQTGPSDTNTKSVIKLNYNALLEGRSVEIQLNNTGTLYTATISQTSTFDSPAIAKYVAPVNNNPLLTSPSDTLVYDLAKAPIVASSFDKTKHQGTATGKERFYHYDAANGVWTLWDRDKVTVGANTLLNFSKGNSYWGRMDINGDGNITSSTVAGLYLGKTGLTTADAGVYTGKLTPDAWNMLAFDPAQHPDIRNSTTGLSITANAIVQNDAITIVDETGVNAVDVNFTGVATDYNTTAKASEYINKVIEAAKLLGKVPKAFSVKAFGSAAGTSPFVFVSDKKFTVKDQVGDVLLIAKTLANQDPVYTGTGLVAAITDVNTTGVTSRYGEYSLLIEPLVGAGTASNTDSGVPSANSLSAKVQFGDISGDSTAAGTTPVPLGLAGNGVATTLTTAASTLATDNVFVNTTTPSTGQILQLDTNFNGTADMLLASSTKPFYIKDHTYTRIYSIDTTTSGTGATTPVAYTVKNTASATLTPVTNDAVAAFVTAINAQADTNATTATYAAADSANLVVFTPDSSLMDLLDADSASMDYFTQTTSSADISKGAVKQVINVSKLARQDVILNKKLLTFSSLPLTTQAESNLTVTTSVAGVSIVPAGYAFPAQSWDDTKIIAMLDALVLNLNTALQSAGVAAFASHDYVNGYNDITKAIITLQGVDIGATALSETNATAIAATATEANSNAGTIDVAGADIIGDLKDNPIYTPDYVNYGPLYTLKDAGYEAKAILRPSTNIALTPTTHWDGIDLTRASSDWLKNNEFNLFSVDNGSGYWVYLTSYTNPNTVSSNNVVLTPTFAYHFNPLTDATNNIVSTSAFSVDVANINAATSNAKLVINGNEIQLTNTGSTYTANINEYEAGLTSGLANTFILRMADGLGERYDNLNLVTLDYVKPVAPTVVFNKSAEATFADASTDVKDYYLWANFIPDNGANATGPIDLNTSTSYNMCTATTFASSTPYKLVAVDGVGTFAKANISNAKSFTFVNAEKDATVLTHSFGNSASTAMRYDANCVATGTTTKSGVEVRAQQVGNVKLSYQHIVGAINNTNDIPVTSFYSVSGTAVIQVDSLGIYAGKPFYVQYNNALYSASFPASRAAADTTFTSPTALVLVSSANQKLD